MPDDVLAVRSPVWIITNLMSFLKHPVRVFEHWLMSPSPAVPPWMRALWLRELEASRRGRQWTLPVSRPAFWLCYEITNPERWSGNPASALMLTSARPATLDIMNIFAGKFEVWPCGKKLISSTQCLYNTDHKLGFVIKLWFGKLKNCQTEY